MGPAKKSHKYTEKEKRTVAYHEAGHAVLGIKLDNANEVQKITIVPRGNAGGYNLMLPKEETYLSTKQEQVLHFVQLEKMVLRHRQQESVWLRQLLLRWQPVERLQH